MTKIEIRNNIIKFIISLAFGVLAFFSARRWYFATNPLLEVSYFAETIIALIICAVSFFIFPILGKGLSGWIEETITKTVSLTLKKFIREQQLKNKKKVAERKEEKERYQKYKGALFLDTSAIIDGRIVEVARAGFLLGKIVAPRFVLEEVQQVSDSSASLKRQRGRRGLDNVNELKKIIGKNFSILETKNGGEVDKLLINYAKKYDAKLVTVDFNLNKLAKVSGITVLNVNDLASALTTVVLIGEKILVTIKQKGKEEDQGVGFLGDGTMVVVTGGQSFIGQEKEVEVTRVLQKEAGKMIFAKIAG
ncbi:hypothetical protein COT49_01740 [candidate division WWE3 bacterium CG08_land_8_20_14_0_20_40_13]|uniref:TRAM domain-containing protein n=1 Tax=candidate division WWE3 bacterium CG08_land_8_20_14_0_20_40_13 TaxID=1975084 RepID=A0A2H0XE50_UNCKA|nr:MAG: hypothetical protein COT49_01740 [candidate division WWE3 bacterium CG08_land_8_20_14_0_20_40_13]